MRSVIEHIKISPEQYSIPQSSAVAHRINRRLVFNYHRYLQQPFSLACNDLKICYDRIFHPATSLDLKHLWTPLTPIIIMLAKIQRMLHNVRTESGDSNIIYDRDTIPEEFRHFMMVLYQENGCAPQLQSIISSIVFSELCTQGFGINFVKSFTT